MPPPIIVAHRGYAARYPENTLAALQAAVAAGARWLEFDIQLSADAVPVLLHDADLKRTAGRPGSVFELTARQLQEIAVGEAERLGERFASVHIPTLAGVVEWLESEPQVQAFVELKVESIQHFGAGRVCRAVADVLSSVRDRCVLISYDDAFLSAARRTLPMRIGWVLADWDEAHRQRARILAPDVLFINQARLPPEPAPLWPGPWQWAAYEITSGDQALGLAARGITFIETMAIGELLAEVRLTPWPPA